MTKASPNSHGSRLARVESALTALHGMIDMGIRKAHGITLEQYVDAISRLSKKEPIQNPELFSVLVAVTCMKGILDGVEEAHAPGCGIYGHAAYVPINCTCGLYGAVAGKGSKTIDLGFGAKVSAQMVKASSLADEDIDTLRGFVKEQVNLIGRDQWIKNGGELLHKRIAQITATRQAERDF